MDEVDKSNLVITKTATVMSLYPLILNLVFAWSLISFVYEPQWYKPLISLFIAYAIPLISFKIHNYFFPLVEGKRFTPDGAYHPYLGSFYIQSFYHTFPVFERLLQSVPNLYKVWLRLWGSKIGKYVIFPPTMRVVDRSLIDVGDFVSFGGDTYIASHIVSPTVEGKMLFYIKKVKIENRCFVGAFSVIGPGIVLKEGTLVPTGSNLIVNKTYTADDFAVKIPHVPASNEKKQ